MSGKRGRASADDLLKATWEYQKEVEACYKVRIRVDFCMVRFRRGVYDLHYQAWPESLEESAKAPWQYTVPYPNPRNETLASCLFTGMLRFEHQLADALGVTQALRAIASD